MEIDEAGPIFAQKPIKDYMGERYLYPIVWEQNIVAIVHIYGARAVLLLFLDYRYTESE